MVEPTHSLPQLQPLNGTAIAGDALIRPIPIADTSAIALKVVFFIFFPPKTDLNEMNVPKNSLLT